MAHNFSNHDISSERAVKAARRTRETGMDRLQQERRRLLQAAQQWDPAYTFTVDTPRYACCIF